jgi:hypothetical protein
LAYKDDIHNIGRTTTAVNEEFVNLVSTAKEMGLTINKSKPNTQKQEVI